MECVVCLEKSGKKPFVHNPSLESLEKLLTRVHERAYYKDSIVLNFAGRVQGITAADLFAKKSGYHKSCYAEFANVGKLERAKKRYSDSIECGESSVIKRRVGRP